MLCNLPASHALSFRFAWSTATKKRASNSSENVFLEEQEKRAATGEDLSQRFLGAGVLLLQTAHTHKLC